MRVRIILPKMLITARDIPRGEWMMEEMGQEAGLRARKPVGFVSASTVEHERIYADLWATKSEWSSNVAYVRALIYTRNSNAFDAVY